MKSFGRRREHIIDEVELKDTAIREFANLQRIKAAQDKAVEIEYQEMVLRVRLAVLGVSTDGIEWKV